MHVPLAHWKLSTDLVQLLPKVPARMPNQSTFILTNHTDPPGKEQVTMCKLIV